MKKIIIKNFVISENSPCFIIAEIGVNHNGNLETAKQLITLAKKAGADAVKFQTFKAEEVITRTANKADYQKDTQGDTYFDMIKKLELSFSDFKEISLHAKKEKIIFFSKAAYFGAVSMLKKLGVPVFKIDSSRLTHYPLLRYTAEQQLPLIVSTGMATLNEVKEAVKIIKKTGNENIAILHCTSNYPTNLDEVNLLVIQTLQKVFPNYPIGYSDHSLGIEVPAIAVALGAKIIEKHFTYDKNAQGPDHKVSLTPIEFKQMVKSIRNIERNNFDLKETFKMLKTKFNSNLLQKQLKVILGSEIKQPTEREIKEIMPIVRISMRAKKSIPKGTIITKNLVAFKRPADGLSPKYFNQLINKKINKNMKKDEPFTLDIIK